MKKALSILVAGLSLCATTTAQSAVATKCLTPGEMHGLIAYILPATLSRVTQACRTQLPADSYFATKGAELVRQLHEGKPAAWPAAKAAFFKFSNDPKAVKAAGLPDDAVRELVDKEMTARLTFPIDASTCAEANDIAEALAPLSAEQTVHLVATIFNAVARKDDQMRSCPRESR